MAKLKKNKTSNYTVIDNGVFKNKGLSLKAKGLLCLMLSLPDDWDYTLAGLAGLSADGLDSTRSALNELEVAKYFARRTLRVGGKFDDVEYVISEVPMLGKPMLENPILENPTQLNTKENKVKKIYNTDIYKDIMDDYNSICDRLIKAERLTNSRKTHIKARLAEISREELTIAFHKANESDFICGKNNRGWKADFDWLMKNGDNISKVLEGKYDNRKQISQTEAELMDAYNAIRGGESDNKPFFGE